MILSNFGFGCAEKRDFLSFFFEHFTVYNIFFHVRIYKMKVFFFSCPGIVCQLFTYREHIHISRPATLLSPLTFSCFQSVVVAVL